ncbi:hypothetical protein [Oceanobacillus picturae]|uniref:hypothetical protein n=1 Tax=Oceanobacillus picturae TaxID=171693 RepID=UPI000E687134|nr:hypothetical protein [Oceanobacillus picturae]RIU94898.1 hypothetical protein D1864_03765 [Oceanobacillus picturae]
MIIYKPEVVQINNTAMLQAKFEIENKQDSLWFSVPLAYEQYLLQERADSFLVGLLPLAMERGEDICLKAPVSEKLYYTITTYLMGALCVALPHLNRISIRAETLMPNPVETANAVGTGFSGGVDSFHTIYEHLHRACPPSFRLTHFTFHNVGSHGDFGGQEARDLFQKRIQLIRPFAEEQHIDIIEIDSNLSEVLKMNYVQTHTLRNVAAVLTMQKLFRYYYYSSGRQFKDFELKTKVAGSYDLLSLTMLSTESLSFFSSGANYSRVEKTRHITEYEPTHRYLNVCAGGSSANCSRCEKCLRSMLTLEVQGKLDLYHHVFDLHVYRQEKTKYIAKVLADVKKDAYAAEIYNEMRKHAFPISASSYLIMPYYKIKHRLKRLIMQGK